MAGEPKKLYRSPLYQPVSRLYFVVQLVCLAVLMVEVFGNFGPRWLFYMILLSAAGILYARLILMARDAG